MLTKKQRVALDTAKEIATAGLVAKLDEDFTLRCHTTLNAIDEALKEDTTGTVNTQPAEPKELHPVEQAGDVMGYIKAKGYDVKSVARVLYNAT
jgi:hypothetical protein